MPSIDKMNKNQRIEFYKREDPREKPKPRYREVTKPGKEQNYSRKKVEDLFKDRDLQDSIKEIWE